MVIAMVTSYPQLLAKPSLMLPVIMALGLKRQVLFGATFKAIPDNTLSFIYLAESFTQSRVIQCLE